MKNIGKPSSSDLTNITSDNESAAIKDDGKSVGSMNSKKVSIPDDEGSVQKKLPMTMTKQHSSLLEMTQRKVAVNHDGSRDIEQGPMNLSNDAKIEMKYWVYNSEPLSVFRGEYLAPEDIIKNGGLHCRALSSNGVEYHLRSTTAVDTSGAISTTTDQNMARHYAGYKATAKPELNGYLYKIELQEQ